MCSGTGASLQQRRGNPHTEPLVDLSHMSALNRDKKSGQEVQPSGDSDTGNKRGFRGAGGHVQRHWGDF